MLTDIFRTRYGYRVLRLTSGLARPTRPTGSGYAVGEYPVRRWPPDRFVAAPSVCIGLPLTPESVPRLLSQTTANTGRPTDAHRMRLGCGGPVGSGSEIEGGDR